MAERVVRTLVVDDGVGPGTLNHLPGWYEAIPATVTITRTSQEDFASRQLEVTIDDEHVATLLWGDSVTRELPAGPHRLRVHNTLMWRTVDFVLQPEEQIFYEAVNRTGPGTILFTLLLGVGPLYLTLKRM